MSMWPVYALAGVGIGFLVLLAIGILRTLRERRKGNTVDDDDMPDSPMNGTVQVGIAVHEMYLALKTAGFTEEQALYLVSNQMCGGPRAVPQ